MSMSFLFNPDLFRTPDDRSGGYNCRHKIVPAKRSASELQRLMDDTLAKENYEVAAKLLPILQQEEQREHFREIEALCEYVGVALPKVSAD